MRPLILLALLFSATVAFNIFRDEVVPDEQLLTVVRTARKADASSDSSDSDENETKDGSGSGALVEEEGEQLRRVVRSLEEEASGEGSGIEEVTSAPVRFIRSVDVEGSGSGDVAVADE